MDAFVALKALVLQNAVGKIDLREKHTWRVSTHNRVLPRLSWRANGYFLPSTPRVASLGSATVLCFTNNTHRWPRILTSRCHRIGPQWFRFLVRDPSGLPRLLRGGGGCLTHVEDLPDEPGQARQEHSPMKEFRDRCVWFRGCLWRLERVVDLPRTPVELRP